MKPNPALSLMRLPALPEVAAETYFVAPEKRLDGNPQQTVWLEYADPSGQFCAGIWASEVGAWRIHYTEHEYCRILAGRSLITDESGTATTVTAGDEFVIPAGFIGTWRVLEPTRKRFILYEQQP